MRNTRKINHGRCIRHGFTLIEAMIASVVLAFCVVGVCGMLVASMQNSKAAQNHIIASGAAKNSMDSVVSRNLDQYSAATGASNQEVLSSSVLNAGDEAEVEGQLTYIQRHAAQAPRGMGVVAITATTPDGQQVTIYKLVTRTELP